MLARGAIWRRVKSICSASTCRASACAIRAKGTVSAPKVSSTLRYSIWALYSSWRASARSAAMSAGSGPTGPVQALPQKAVARSGAVA